MTAMTTRWAAAVLATLALTACSRDPKLRWTEEVRLSDQLTIVVTRQSEFRAAHELGKTPGESRTSLRFAHPATGEIVLYETSLVATTEELVAAGTVTPSSPALMQYPVALIAKDKDLFVVAELLGDSPTYFGCPDPAFILYRWESGRWQRRPLEEIPQRIFSSNLTQNPDRSRRDIEGHAGHLTAEQINRDLTDSRVIHHDLSGMAAQTFDLPPNCKSCTTYVKIGDRANDPRTGPFCTRPSRHWLEHEHLSN